MNPTLDLSELDAKIGRLFMAGMPGPVVDSKTDALIRDFSLGGIILFSRNIKDPFQLARLCADLQERAMKYNGIPLFIAVDQEGGRVARLKEPFTVFPGNSAIGEDPDPFEKAIRFAEVTAKEMRLVGLNMDMAPVLDVRRGEPEKHLSGRMFGNDPEAVGTLGLTVIKVLQERGVMAVAKHFPGLGAAPLDPHHKLPVMDLTGKELEKADLPPFKGAIDGGVSSIMTSHAVYPCLDPENPATLSKKIITDLLREKLGFTGLVITDDLDMGAITGGMQVAEGALRAFEAGTDILLICNKQKGVHESIKAIRWHILKGNITFERLHHSLERIGRAKKRYLKKEINISLSGVEDYFDLKKPGA